MKPPHTQKFRQTQAPEAVTTTIARDKLGNIDYVTQGTVTRDYIYDSRYYLTQITHPETGPSGDYGIYYERDNLGNITSSRVGLTGAKTIYMYDDLERIDFINYPSASTPDVDYVYYPSGELKDVIRGGISINYQYNPNGIITQEKVTVGAPVNKSYTTVYARNLLDNIEKVTYPSGLEISTWPDDLGRATSLTSTNPLLTFANNINYKPSGLLETITYGNGVNTLIGYDVRNRIGSIVAKQGASTVTDFVYGYDNRSNITKITDNAYPAFSLSSIGYDGVDRLTTINGTNVIGYDVLGNITYKNIANKNLTFNYDTTRNRISSVTGSYHIFGYDSYGNVTSNGQNSFSYGDNGELLSVVGKNLNYYYDGNGKLVYRTDNGNYKVYIYDYSGKLIHEDSIEGQSDRIYSGSQLVAVYDKCGSYDQDGDTIPSCDERRLGLSPTNQADASQDWDADGLSNSQEFVLKTSLSRSDTDNDGYGDRLEVDLKMDPTLYDNPNDDKDQDGLTTAQEVIAGSYPYIKDSDSDGMSDGYEIKYGLLVRVNDAAGDKDGDSLTNLDEFLKNTKANDPDSDHDGTPDGVEVANGTNPNFDEKLIPILVIIKTLLL